MSLGFELGYRMVFDERGLGELERAGGARAEYEDRIRYLRGAAREAFEDEVSRGREKAEYDVQFEC